MKTAIILACLLLTPGPQEKAKTAREAALEAIRDAKPVGGEKNTTAGSPSRSTEKAVPGGGGGTGRPVFAGSGGTVGSAGSRASAPAKGVSAAERKTSDLFTANAQYQQELANRTQIVSVADIATPEAALAELEAGNRRFAAGGRVRTLMAAQEPGLRELLAVGQAPFAVVVSCSDSRSADNLVFDQELGRLFSVRTAGNCLDTLGIASVEYAVEHLGAKVVVVMGHTSCGAVGAVAKSGGETLGGTQYIFQDLMAGLLDAVKKDPNETDPEHISRLERENARRQAQTIYDRSDLLRASVDGGKVLLLSASLDLATGVVTFYRQVAGWAKTGDRTTDHRPL